MGAAQGRAIRPPGKEHTNESFVRAPRGGGVARGRTALLLVLGLMHLFDRMRRSSRKVATLWLPKANGPPGPSSDTPQNLGGVPSFPRKGPNRLLIQTTPRSNPRSSSPTSPCAGVKPRCPRTVVLVYCLRPWKEGSDRT